MNITMCLLAGLALVLGNARAQDYPNRQIQIIVPFAPGGGTDIVSRTVAAKMTDSWKVPVIVDNRPGGNTIIGAQLAARAAPDGYTMFVAIDSTLAMNQSLYAKLPYDPIKDFAPVTLAISQPMVLAVHPSVQATTVKDLIALAKAKPGQIAYAQGALPAQIAGELFKSAAGIDLIGVPYKGSGPAMNDVVGGSVPVIFDALGPAASFIKAGKVRALAVTSAEPAAALPGVPTMAQSGLAGFDLVTWIGFLVPSGVNREIVSKLNSELVRILNLPETKERFAGMGMTVIASSPDQFAQTIKSDAAKFDRIIKSAGIKVE
jgi:tripartite-type tricarboxylate transporter receptor subunit TctC